ncbi:MAG TPA: phosphoribosylglycinamide formyltransferase [Clostridia bacterium]|nr:phosphoribosylglycinamide formyltransferase [Clostridiaceae bacterium]HOF26822.1 phosphoribosylglycinamide formyltransferase [Clostridia bacterium]HOM33887.1 phosphoribosylglycinamide formyltransferase [Clostridia bacterium]HOR89855.1 phosphoribosylglycinamide formyltransferase [Clostridia bacterium]HOT69961.1 phosphoribosylglycinamide formyltransferase [Clostridia bacterium]
MNICVFASGGGSNMQAVIDACKNRKINAKVVLVISNNSDAYALERAKKEKIDNYHVSEYKYKEGFIDKLLELLAKYEIDLVLLAGYMKKLPKEIVERYKVLNIHPALLPKYGGRGMYGERVHKAVLEAKEKESGCTVHVVDEHYDNGKILNQIKVPVLEDDTVETLAKRVLEQEHIIYVDTVKKILTKEIEI